MRFSTLLGSAVLLVAGAALSTAYFLSSERNNGRDVRLASDQFAELSARLDRLEKALSKEARAPSPAPVQATETRSEPRRTEDLDSATTALLSEIAASLKVLAGSTRVAANSEAAGITKRPESLAKVMELDSLDRRKLSQRHFCWSPAQLYETYGMPDIVNRVDPTRTQWTYRTEGSPGRIFFIFDNGILTEVNLPASDNR